MKNNLVTSSLVANSTEKAWSQAYVTLNVFIIIGIEQEAENINIAAEGKKILDKLQKEYFSLTQKNLVNIKQALEETKKEIAEGLSFSIIVSSIFDDILYVVTAGSGNAILKRGDQTGIVAEGEEGKVKAFSGTVQDKDIVFLATRSFSEKIPSYKIVKLLDDLGPSDIAENIAPIIHGSSIGSEAAIIFRYKKGFPAEEINANEEEKTTQTNNGREERPKSIFFFDFLHKIKRVRLKGIAGSEAKKPSVKKLAILAMIFILLLSIAIGIVFERKKQERARDRLLFQTIISPAQKDFDQGLNLIGLNRSLAGENFSRVISSLQDKKSQFKQGSEERQAIDTLIQKSQEQINNLSAQTVTKEKKEIVMVNSSSKIKNIAKITFKNGYILLLDENGEIFQISESGEIKKDLGGEQNSKNIISDSTYIYVLSNNYLTKIDRESGKKEKIIDNLPNSEVAIGTFIGNLYLLNSDGNTIEKYASPSYLKSSYFNNMVNFAAPPVDMTIDGSIYTLDKNGNIRKFTRGNEDSFTVKGLIKPLEANSLIYTDINYNNIYVLDKDNKRIVAIAKSGDVQNQYDIGDVEKITSFAVDEPNKNIFISTTDKLYVINL